MAVAFGDNEHRWLWVPAFAGTTAYRAGINVGPTDRMGLSPAASVETGAGGAVSAAGAGGGLAAAVLGAPFFPVVDGAFGAGGRAIFFALSSVAMMAPCCSAAALSSTLFRAPDQVCPAALQAQDGLNSCRRGTGCGAGV